MARKTRDKNKSTTCVSLVLILSVIWSFTPIRAEVDKSTALGDALYQNHLARTDFACWALFLAADVRFPENSDTQLNLFFSNKDLASHFGGKTKANLEALGIDTSDTDNLNLLEEQLLIEVGPYSEQFVALKNDVDFPNAGIHTAFSPISEIMLRGEYQRCLEIAAGDLKTDTERNND